MRRWMESFVDYTMTKQGMAEALPAILADREGPRAASRDALRQAVETLIAAGARTGELRDDLDAADVLMALGGITLISEHEHQRDLATRLIALLLDALVASRP
ncbi:MAG TPA: TetR family transcriptional regulator [Solirubrobacterales bacterium]